MRADKVVDILNKLCPAEYACDWDNPGMHVGHMDNEINKVLITVDVDDKAVDRAIREGAQMIIAHHPLIFHGINQINDQSSIGRRILAMAENHINCYCMHTNFDIAGGMADFAAKKAGLNNCQVLEIEKDEMGIGLIGDFDKPHTIIDICNRIKKEFELEKVVVYGDTKAIINKAAIVPGSGKDEIKLAVEKGAQLLITGDITYHYGIDATADGLCIIDAGHYGLEHIFMDIVRDYLVNQKVNIEIVCMEYDNPQKYI